MGVLNDKCKSYENDCDNVESTDFSDHNNDDESDENPLKMVDAASERTPIKDVPTLGSMVTVNSESE